MGADSPSNWDIMTVMCRLASLKLDNEEEEDAGARRSSGYQEAYYRHGPRSRKRRRRGCWHTETHRGQWDTQVGRNSASHVGQRDQILLSSYDQRRD